MARMCGVELPYPDSNSIGNEKKNTYVGLPKKWGEGGRRVRWS